MEARVLIVFCIVISLSEEIFADVGVEVKRGAYPYMAFVYYPDETVVDARGMRLLRSAILIRPEWLTTSAIGLSIDDGNTNGFPRNNLLARVGSTTIDTNLTLNEDEDEQEREIIQIVRPYNHSATQWWHTDISLMKTLLPFEITRSVGAGTVNFKQEYEEKTCLILVYSKKYSNTTEGKILMQLSVDLLPSSLDNCGQYYVANTMICASDSDENKNPMYDTMTFCQGNSGGPLICDGKVIGLQTYIENNCKQPHLYQLLSAWENFITCGTENKCQEEQCANICIVANKDPATTQSISTTSKPTYMTTARKSHNSEKITTTTTMIEDPVEESGIQTPTLTSTLTTTSTTRTTTETNTESTSIDTIITTEYTITTLKTMEEETLDTIPWPNEKYKDERKKLEDSEKDIERKINVEAQQQKDVKLEKAHSAAQRIVCMCQSLFFFIFSCALFDLILMFYFCSF